MNILIAGAIAMTTALAASAAPLDVRDAALAKIGIAVARGDQDALAAAFGEAPFLRASEKAQRTGPQSRQGIPV